MRRFAVFLIVFQSILFLGHYFLYETLVHAFHPLNQSVTWAWGWTLAVLSVSFLSAGLLAFRQRNWLVRVFYSVSAVWLGAFNYLFLAACFWWLSYGLARALGSSLSGSNVGYWLFGAALVVSIYGLVNAAILRVKRIEIRLANLPEAWRGRTVALISDLHLGHVRNSGTARRIVQRINREKPDLVIIAGDLFDGTAVDAVHVTAPLGDLQVPHGTYFCEGNHEEFRDPRPFLEAISKAGVRILSRQKVDLAGLQLIGVAYLDATHTEHLRSVLAGLQIDRNRASILITHAPDLPFVAEEAGISLQVSGHTHGGQFIPHTWIAKRIYRQFVHGLSRIGNLQVYTSYGAGSWGPPLRVGTYPEMALLQLNSEGSE